MARSVELARAFITIEAETKGLEGQLKSAEKALGRTATFIRAHPIAAAGALGTAALGAAFELAKMAEQTNRALGVIADRVPGATGKVDELREMANQLAITYGESQEKVLQVMDATSKAGAHNVEELRQVSEAAIQAGKALGTNGEELVGGLDAALDIFGVSASNAGAAMALFFSAAEGRTSVQDLLGTVEALAGAVQDTGLDLETTTRAIAALIDQGFEPGKKVIAEFKEQLKNGGVPAIQDLAAQAPIAKDAMEKYSEAIRRNTTDIESNVQRAQSQLKAALTDLGTTLTPLVAKVTALAAATVKALLGGGLAGGGVYGAATQVAAAAAGLAGQTTKATGSIADLGNSGGAAAKGVSTLTAAQRAAIEASEKLTDEQKQGLLTTGQLSEAQRKQLATALKEAAEAAKKNVDAQRASRKTLLELEKEYGDGRVTIEEAQRLAVEELEIKFNEKMDELRGADKEKALALFKTTKDRLVEHYENLEEAVQPPLKRLINTEDDLRLGTEDLAGVVEKKGGKAFAELTVKTEGAKEEQRKLNERIADGGYKVARYADAILGLAETFGVADDDMRRLVDSVWDMADGLGLIASGRWFEGITKGLAGLGKALGSLFGESEAERKLKEALDKNRNRLEQLSRDIGDLNLNLTGKQLSGTQGALREFFGGGGAGKKGWGDTLGQLLLSKGVTVADLDEVAKTLGLEIRPNGHLDPRALEQLWRAMGNIEPSQFATTFSGKQSEFQHQAEVFGWDASTKASRFAGLLGSESSAFAGIFDGLDLTVPEDLAKALESLQALEIRRASGGVSTAELGGLTGGQFAEAIVQMLGLLRDLKDEELAAAKQAAEESERTRKDAEDATTRAEKEAQDAKEKAEREADRIRQDAKDAREDADRLEIAADREALQARQAAEKAAASPEDAILAETARIAQREADVARQKATEARAEANRYVTGAEADTTPIRVESVPDLVFTPNLLASNWEELLALETSLDANVAAILERLPSVPLATPPAIPAAMLAALAGPVGASAPSLGGFSLHIENVIIQPRGTGEDPRALASEFLSELGRLADEVLGDRLQTLRDARGDTSRSFR